jgi:hypothetical protein
MKLLNIFNSICVGIRVYDKEWRVLITEYALGALYK